MIHAHLTLGQFTAFYLYLNMLIGPMRSLGVTLDLAQRATASGARIFQLLDREPRLSATPRRRALPAGNGHVQLRGVTLRYEPAPTSSARPTPKPRRRRPDARCCATSTSTSPAGRTVALVGATGSGKTSLVSLISRLYDPTAGQVLLDGADVREVSLRIVAPGDRGRQRRPLPVLRHRRGEHRLRPPRRPARRSKRPRARAQAYEFIARLPAGLSRRASASAG